MAAEFKFVVDGIELSDDQRAAIAQAVAAAGTVALNEAVRPGQAYVEIGAVNLRKWELIGKRVLLGQLAEEFGEKAQGIVDFSR
ncbi:hypothetical protein [Saccharothrix variisporea]|uniref:Uncharacterized protein n=1 Tax=Saccharothrix variisporea TaxID=543527 RepID=A0A495WYP8_9PSEU|nr:hypothetical protein [Saccharothrix variisporea]RKT66842.1 hypothetical protein DFJ66_0006 [Saccharothrix variisporea]